MVARTFYRKEANRTPLSDVIHHVDRMTDCLHSSLQCAAGMQTSGRHLNYGPFLFKIITDKNPVSSIFSFKKKMLLYSIILAGLCRLYSSSLSVMSYVASLNKACDPASMYRQRSVLPKLQAQYVHHSSQSFIFIRLIVLFLYFIANVGTEYCRIRPTRIIAALLLVS